MNDHETRQPTKCSWVRKRDNALQLQAGLWWVGCVGASELQKGLFFWKVTLCPKAVEGYAKSEDEAVHLVEALIKSDSSYEYNVANKVPKAKALAPAEAQ